MLGLNPQSEQDMLRSAEIEGRVAKVDDIINAPTDPWLFEGAGQAIGLGFGHGVLAEPLLLGVDAVAKPVEDLYKNDDSWLGKTITGTAQSAQRAARDFLRFTTPDPKTTGTASEYLFGLSSMLPQVAVGALAGPEGMAALPAILHGYSRNVELEGKADAVTRASIGAIEGASVAAGAVMPMAGAVSKFLPGVNGLIDKVVTGMAGNAVLGAATRYKSGEVLRGAGYSELADQYDVMDKAAIIGDIVMGAGFGAVAHLVPHEATDAAIVARGNYHAEVETAPGIPTDTQSRNDHNAAVEAKMEELLTGEPKDITQYIRPTKDAAAGDKYTVTGAVNEDSAVTVKLIGDAERGWAIIPEDGQLEGTVIDINNAVKSGMSIEQAISVNMGKDARTEAHNKGTEFIPDPEKTAQYDVMKSAIEESGLGDIMRQNDELAKTLTDLGIDPKYSKGGFTSAVETAASAIKQEKGSGDQFLAQIKNTAGVKEEEISWLGLDEFLAGKKSVTKQEVMDFIAQNKVQLEDKTLRTPIDQSDEDILAELQDRQAGQVGEQPPSDGPTKFNQYTLPGGKNYREVLLTLPDKGREPTFEEWFNKTKIHPVEHYRDKPDMMDIFQRAYEREKSNMPKEGIYRSSHFDQPNILAHVRLNDRVDADGKKVLFVEEIQSDWHQAGRKKGYKGVDKLTADERAKYDSLTERYPEERTTEENAFVSEIGRRLSEWPVPDAPFKKTWHELAFKRILQEAVAKGYDRVAWTTGEQQAERYDLSKQISRLRLYEKDGKLSLSAWDNSDKNVMDLKPVTKEDLADHIGKEAAQKLLDQKPNKQGMRELSGVDLKVGGEGMEGFYDKIIPDYAKKLGKKYGAKVGETEIQQDNPWHYADPMNDDEAKAIANEPATIGLKAHSLDITPELRAAVEGGLPMFARGEGVGKTSTVEDMTNAVRSSFGDATDALLKAGKIKVVQSAKDLPGKHTEADGKIRGMTDAKGNAYIVADNVSPEKAKSIVLHEVGGHVGMEKMLGKKLFNQLLSEVEARAMAGEEVFRAAKEAVPTDTRPEHYREEILTYLIEKAPEQKIVQRIIAGIRQWLYKISGGKLITLTEADLREMAVAALKREAKMADVFGGGEQKYSKVTDVKKGYIRLYRGLEQKFNKNHDLKTTDAPHGYSTWTDNKELARQYAGENGHVYYLDLPENERGTEIIGQDGERPLFLDNEKKAGLNNISGKEYLVYTQHEKYDANQIKELNSDANTMYAKDEQTKAPTTLEDQILADRPDTRVVNDSGFQMFGKDALEAVGEKIKEATKNSKLIEVAANCGLRG